MKGKSASRRNLILAASSLLAVSCAHAQDQNGTWLGDSAGDWTDGTKWTDGLIANGPDFTATFGNVITAATTITLNGNRTIGNITALDTNQNYTLTGNTGVIINPGFTVDVDSPSTGTDTVTLAVPQTPDARKFARLKVVITP